MQELSHFDKLINGYKEEINRLEAERQQAEARQAALDGVKPLLDDYAQRHGLTRQDLFRVLEKDIEKWIKSLRGEPEGIHQHLKSYYTRVLSEGDTGPAPKQPPEPKLAAGLYTNPYTQEQVLKKTRAPRALREWVQVYGLGTVETWRK